MAELSLRRSCFVVMPFGEKTDLDGRSIDFNDIYEYFFKRTVKSLEKEVEDLGIKLEITCTRCDEIDESGSLHEMMIRMIYQSDIVVVDITTANANVYYELGIRHALAKGVTILIRRKGTTIPFNIQGRQVVEYDQERFKSVEAARTRIREIIKNSLKFRINDSPVHDVLDLNIEPEGKPLGDRKMFEAPLRKAPHLSLGLVTGDLQNVRSGIDAWVNVENTYMQMARIFDNSISGIIRYWGGRNPDTGDFEDTIARELARALEKRSDKYANPADVIVTSSGYMTGTHNVRWIFHTAANVGQVGRGYTPVAGLANCVVNVLEEARNAPPSKDKAKPESVLFPLMGTKTRRGSVDEARVRELIEAALEYLSSNPTTSTFKKVCFLTYTDREFEICRDLLGGWIRDGRLADFKEVGQGPEDARADTPVSKEAAAAGNGKARGVVKPGR